MIAAGDRLELAPGVVLVDGALRDELRDEPFTLNAAAALVLRAGGTVGDAAAALEGAYGLDRGRALADARSFAAQLNDALLANVRARGGAPLLFVRRLASLPRLLPAGKLPRRPSRRARVDTSTAASTLATGALALAPHAGASFAVVAAASGLVLALAGPLSLAVPLALAGAAAGGVVAHELGHLLALRGIPACVVTRGWRVSVAHGGALPWPRRRLVAAAGPVAGVAAAATALAALVVTPRPELAAALLVLSSQALGLTVLARDGRTLCAPR